MLANLRPAPAVIGNVILPSLPSYQEWAINSQTGTLVLVEFPELKNETTAQSTGGTAQSSLEENILLLNRQLSALDARLLQIETLAISPVQLSTAINNNT